MTAANNITQLAVKALEAAREEYRAELALEEANVRYFRACANRCKAVALVGYAESDEIRGGGCLESSYDYTVKAERSARRITECCSYIALIERNLKTDGGRRLAYRWYTRKGQEEGEARCESLAALAYEDAGYGRD